MLKTYDIAQLYAKAIYKCAIDNLHSLDSWKTTLHFMVKILNHKNVRNILAQFHTSKQFSSFLISSFYGKINKYEKNFIKIISENQRLMILEMILQEFIKLCQAHEKKIIANVFSAYSLNEMQSNHIKIMLQKKFKQKKIDIKYNIEKSMIDGLIIRINDKIINASVDFRLRQFLEFLKN